MANILVNVDELKELVQFANLCGTPTPESIRPGGSIFAAIAGEGEDTTKLLVKMKLINLTPHALGVYDAEGKNLIATIPSSGMVRVNTMATPEGEVDLEGAKVPIVETTYGSVGGLPAPEDGTIYIVSVLVIAALKAQGSNRFDVVAPDTGPASVVRDAGGNILGVRRFTR